MPHVLIAGITESGKTTLAKNLCRQYKRKGISTIVLDPMHDPGWQADYQTSNANEFLDVVRRSQRCAIFIDESGDVIGRYNDQMFWLATKARHFGHNSHFIVQRPALLNKTVRDQCRVLFLFQVSIDDAKELYRDFNKEELLSANKLNQMECFYCSRFGAVEKITVKRA